MKVPKLIRPRLPERVFQKKILRRVSVEKDRSFLLGLYAEEAGFRVLKTDLSEDEKKNLKKLVKVIKQNKGAIRTGRIIIITILIAALIVFNILFKNRIVKGVMERGLEAVFQADTEVSGVSFSIIRGHLSFEHLQVAREDAPMRNLFELGSTEISINTAELLKRKYVAQNVICYDIRWNTERETSGADIPKIEKTKLSLPSELMNLDFTALDPKEIISKQMSNLDSFDVVDSLNQEIKATTAEWKESLDGVQDDLMDFSEEIDEIRAIDIRSINTVQEVQNTLKLVEKIVPTAEKLKEDISGLDANIRKDGTRFLETKGRIEDTVNSDVEYLKSLVSLPEGGLKSLIFSIAGEHVANRFGNIYRYLTFASKYTDRLSSDQEKREKPARRRGIDIPFPTERYPVYLLEKMAVSVQTAEEHRSIEGTLKDLSSDPDLWNKATTASFHMISAEREFRLDGELDSRSQSSDYMTLDLDLKGYPFQISEGIETLGIVSMQGTYQFATNLKSSKDGSAEGEALLNLTQITIQRSSDTDPFVDAVYDSLTTAPRIDVEMLYQITPGSPMQISGKSNIDEILSNRIRSYLENLFRDYQGQLEKELRDGLEEILKENDLLFKAYHDIESISGGNLTDVKAYEKVIDDKKNELNSRTKEIEDEVKEKIESEAEKQLDKLKDKIPLPKL